MNTAKQREVVQLLSDWLTWRAAFGGALAPEDSHVRSAQYGPAGIVFTGAEFDRSDRLLLLESFADLWGALARLMREDAEVGKHSNGDPISGVGAYNALREAYLDDPGNYSIVDDWRGRLAQLDQENERRARKKPPIPPRVALVSPRRFLERHDAAIAYLAEDLKYTELHVVFARPMSETEETEMQGKNAEMFAVFQRLRVAGASVPAAKAQTAEKFDIPLSVIERVVEFRSHDKPDTCLWGGCARAPFRQDLCIAHYNQRRRAEKKKAG